MKKLIIKRTTDTRITTPVILVALLFTVTTACKNENTGYTVMKGPFRQSVIETGELQAVKASVITMPRINYIYGYNFKIVGLAEHGKNVRQGDLVIRVDPASVQKYIIEKNELLENEIASANKLKAQQTNNMQDLKAQLMNEEASFSLKKLSLDRSAFESYNIRKVRELEYKQAEIRLNKIKRGLELRPKLDSLDFRIQQIKILQRESEVEAARQTLNMLNVKSPLDGIFVVAENWRNGQMIKVGDEVYLGTPVARIPDVRTMKVKGFVVENDISKIRTGLDVIVRLDALPTVPFHGKVNDLATVCTQREEKKIFATEVLITESDLRLKPGMTVSCEYITWEGKNETYVPNNCILEENKHFYLFVKKRGSVKKVEITTGPSNNSHTVVAGDVKEGQQLVLPENVLTK